MRPRALVALAAALLAALLLLGEIAGRPPVTAPSPRGRQPRPARPAGVRPPASTRNVFEFAPRPVPEVAPRRPAAAPESPEEVPPPVAVPAVRFVGLVRRGGVLKAALQVHGNAVVVGKGEAAGGYTVVAIDTDVVRLRAADGTFLTLDAGGS